MLAEKQVKLLMDYACSAMEEFEVYNERHDDETYIMYGAKGEDLPMICRFVVDAKAETIAVYSYLPFKDPVPDDKLFDVLKACNKINLSLIDGCFLVNDNKSLLFYLGERVGGSLISKETIKRIIGWSFGAVDAFNDKLYLVIQGMLSPDDII